nr:uncharacterized protein LOC117225312 [Megalopta genalis]
MTKVRNIQETLLHLYHRKKVNLLLKIKRTDDSCRYYHKVQYKELAVKYHQLFYELLPDWFLYNYEDHRHIRQRVEFALCDPHDFDKYKKITNDYADISTFQEHDKEIQGIINKIYEKITFIKEFWTDYLENNTLPIRMMVLPQDETYQMLKSPACSPVTTTDLDSRAMSGGWTIGRSVDRLVDLSQHKESISPINDNALAAYFRIASLALSVGINCGTILLSKAIANGSSISNVAKIAYNSLLISNLSISSLGIAYEGYRLIDQYQTKKEINIFNAMLFSLHVLFFSNSLIYAKVAGKLIGTSRGITLIDPFAVAQELLTNGVISISQPTSSPYNKKLVYPMSNLKMIFEIVIKMVQISSDPANCLMLLRSCGSIARRILKNVPWRGLPL